MVNPYFQGIQHNLTASKKPGGFKGVVGLQDWGRFGIWNGIATWTIQQDLGVGVNYWNLKIFPDGPRGTLWRIRSRGSGPWWGDLEYSTDQGVNWVLSLAALDFANDYGIIDYCRTKDGDLFALMTANSALLGAIPPHQYRIYRSQDHGASWQLVYALPDNGSAEYRGASIAAHLTDSNIVAALVSPPAAGANKWTWVITQDGGATWTPSIPATKTGSGYYRAQIAFGAGGRIVHKPSDTTGNLQYSDDLGVTWAPVTTALGALYNLQKQLIYAGKNRWFLAGTISLGGYNMGRIYRSDDNGLVWTLYMQGENIVLTDPQGVDETNTVSFDDYANVLYTCTRRVDPVDPAGANPGGPILRRKEGGGWEDITGDGEAKFSAGLGIGWRSMVAPIAV